jgi:hypothetical protein
MGPEIVALTYQDGLPQFQRYNYILDHQSFYQARYGYVQAQKEAWFWQELAAAVLEASIRRTTQKCVVPRDEVKALKAAQGTRDDQESAPRMAQLNAKQILRTVPAARASSPQDTGCGSRSSGIMPSAPRFRCSCHQPRAATMHTLTVSW